MANMKHKPLSPCLIQHVYTARVASFVARLAVKEEPYATQVLLTLIIVDGDDDKKASATSSWDCSFWSLWVWDVFSCLSWDCDCDAFRHSSFWAWYAFCCSSGKVGQAGCRLLQLLHMECFLLNVVHVAILAKRAATRTAPQHNCHTFHCRNCAALTSKSS